MLDLTFERRKIMKLSFDTNQLLKFVLVILAATISQDDSKNLWQIFEKLFFSMNDYDVVLSLLSNVNACDGWEIHILKINYH